MPLPSLVRAGDVGGWVGHAVASSNMFVMAMWMGSPDAGHGLCSVSMCWGMVFHGVCEMPRQHTGQRVTAATGPTGRRPGWATTDALVISTNGMPILATVQGSRSGSQFIRHAKPPKLVLA